MVLNIAEKESIGRAIGKVLSGEKNSYKTHFECGKDIIAWLQGHVLTLYEPQYCDEKYALWSHETILYVPSV